MELCPVPTAPRHFVLSLVYQLPGFAPRYVITRLTFDVLCGLHSGACTGDWLSYGGAKYLFVMDSARRHDLNHEDAERACRRLDAQLVSVDTDNEFELLKREIRQRVTATGQEFAHEQWWTSGRFKDQRWVWDKHGYPPGQQQNNPSLKWKSETKNN